MAIKKAFGWADISVEILGDIPTDITEITYSLTQSKTNGYGRGNKPTRRGRGNKEYEVRVVMAMEEVVKIQESIREKYGEGYDLTDLEPFDIPVVYENNLKVVQDVIRDFEFTSNGRGAAQGDEEILQEFTGIASDISFVIEV